MAKVHLIGNVLTGTNRPKSRCSLRPIGNGKVNSNSRDTYRFMASSIVSIREFMETPEKNRCAHCMVMGLEARNRARKAKGREPVSDLFQGYRECEGSI
jgi:hypothetical protein